MRQTSGRKAAAGHHPAASRKRRTQRQQQKRARAQVGQQVTGRDPASRVAPGQNQNNGLDRDHNQNEIDQTSVCEQFSHLPTITRRCR